MKPCRIGGQNYKSMAEKEQKQKMKELVNKTDNEEQLIKDIKRILKEIEETEKREGILTIKIDGDFYSIFKLITSDKKEVTKMRPYNRRKEQKILKDIRDRFNNNPPQSPNHNTREGMFTKKKKCEMFTFYIIGKLETNERKQKEK